MRDDLVLEEHPSEIDNSPELIEIATSPEFTEALSEHGACVIGGLAVESWTGVQRSHHDIDIICPKEDVKVLAEKLKNIVAPNDETAEVRSNFITGTTLRFRGLCIQIFPYEFTHSGISINRIEIKLDNPLHISEIRNLRGNTIMAVSLPIIKAIKRAAIRKKDFDDLEQLDNI